jgi:hypothetical protein
MKFPLLHKDKAVAIRIYLIKFSAEAWHSPCGYILSADEKRPARIPLLSEFDAALAVFQFWIRYIMISDA